MPIALFLAALVLQNTPARSGTPPEKVAEAYTQFLLAHHLDEIDDTVGAIAACRPSWPASTSARTSSTRHAPPPSRR
jgi:hypothetical protein